MVTLLPDLDSSNSESGLKLGISHLVRDYLKIVPELAESINCPPTSLRNGDEISSTPLTIQLRMLWKPWLSFFIQKQLLDKNPDTHQLDAVTYQFAVDSWKSGLLDRHAKITSPKLPINVCAPGSIIRLPLDKENVSIADLVTSRVIDDGSGEHFESMTIIISDIFASLIADRIVEQGVENSGVMHPLTIEKSDLRLVESQYTYLLSAFEALSNLGILTWVSSFLSQVVILNSDGEYAGRYGVSSPDIYGVACVEGRGSLPDIVETLVHEASHQAFYLVELGNPLISDHVLAPSPFRTGLRTLRRVLAGAHAFSNSALALESLKILLPETSEVVDKRLAAISPQITASLKMLDQHKSLTDEGQEWVERMMMAHSVSKDANFLISFRTPEPSATTKTNILDKGPWHWRPEKDAWFNKLHSLVGEWHPDPGLQVDVDRVRSALYKAFNEKKEWIYHPCVSVLMNHKSHQERKLQRDFQLIAWLSAFNDSPLGSITIPHPVWLWSPDGGRQIDTGTYILSDLAVNIVNHDCPSSIPLDLWSGSIGVITPEGWNADEVMSPEQQNQAQKDVVTFLKSLRLLERKMPQCFEWLQTATRVVIPMANRGRTTLQSGSRTDLPGTVFVDLFAGEIASLELLVHETAHLYFFLVEFGDPIINPSHKQLYWSPLRYDPRPLRGIFLAYHALAYMCVLYTEAIRVGIVDQNQIRETLTTLQRMMRMSELTLESSRDHLTQIGNSILDHTLEVAQYGY